MRFSSLLMLLLLPFLSLKPPDRHLGELRPFSEIMAVEHGS
jgi:hypothetical protein